MKRIGLLLLMVVMVAGCGKGCESDSGSNDDAVAGVVGTWSLSYTWAGYSTGTVKTHFYSNGKFLADYPPDVKQRTGSWTVKDSFDITLTWDGGSIYRGELNDVYTSMTGTMSNGTMSGTWSAQKSSPTP